MNTIQFTDANNQRAYPSPELKMRAALGAARVYELPAPPTWPSGAVPVTLTTAQRLALSVDYMMAHLNEPIRISMLSTITGYSESRFFELFKNATGDTPLNWFIRARMHWAGELLKNSRQPIKRIAWQVGYADQFYFSRLFKSVHGLSPSHYRKQNELSLQPRTPHTDAGIAAGNDC